MKKLAKFIKEYRLVILIFLITSILVHLPLFIKNILTADVLLNTGYYSSYSWEISLGRFGLYFIGLLKGFMVFPQIEIVLGTLLLLASVILIFDLFQIQNKLLQVMVSILVVCSPIVSATLLFHYCALPYFLAFFGGVFAVYLFVKAKKKIWKYGVPIFLIILSLSMYQAYLAIPLTILLFYWMIQVLQKKFSWKDFFLSFGIVLIGTIFYYIAMKLSLFVFNIELDSYRGANSIGLSSLLDIPNRLLFAYQSFFEFYFADRIVTNSNVGMSIIYIFFFVLFLVAIVYRLIQYKMHWKSILLFIILLLFVPVTINVITILLPDTKMQLLMSSGYLLVFFFFYYFIQDKHFLRVVGIVIFLFMIRGYLIQVQATYQTLSNTYQKTYEIASDIRSEVKNYSDMPVMISGSLEDNPIYAKDYTTQLDTISHLTYGFVSNYSLFWDEYSNIKNGWSRFMELYLGYPIHFVEEDTYYSILDSPSYKKMSCYPEGKIQVIDGVVVVKLSN